MRALGMPSGPLRKPLKPLEGDALQKGIDIAARLGLDKIYGYTLNGKARAA